MSEENAPQKERYLREVEQKLLHRELDAKLLEDGMMTRRSRMPKKSSSKVCRSKSNFFCRSRRRSSAQQWNRQCNICKEPRFRLEVSAFLRSGRNFMKHSQEEYWRPRFHAPPLRSHPDPPPTIQCSWYPYEGQCPYMRLALVCWRSNGECTFTDMQKIEKRGEKHV